MQKKYLVIISLFLIIGLIGGCSNSPGDVTSDPTVDKVHVSFKSVTEEQEMESMVLKEDLQIFDPDIYAHPFNTYKTDEQNDNLGERVEIATPIKMITGIPDLRLSSPDGNRTLINDNFVNTTETSGFSIVPLLDIVYAKDLINNKALFENGGVDFEEIELTIGAKDFMFIPKSSWDGASPPDIDRTFETYSEIHVELSEKYSDVTFENEKKDPIYEPENDNVHVFTLMDLLPLDSSDGDPHSILFFFDKKIEEPRIYNPTGERVEGYNPNLWESDREANWSGYFIYMPGKDINFTSGNKEITFVWNIKDLIEVYDNNTDDLEDDLVTLRLDNPFPISFEVDTYSEPEISAESPDEVDYLEGEYFNEDVLENQIILRWINPSQESFKKVHIVKKEGSPPSDIEDGEKVFEDSFPVFFDKDISEGKTYYYRVFVENSSGQYSHGETIDVKAY